MTPETIAAFGGVLSAVFAGVSALYVARQKSLSEDNSIKIIDLEKSRIFLKEQIQIYEERIKETQKQHREDLQQIKNRNKKDIQQITALYEEKMDLQSKQISALMESQNRYRKEINILKTEHSEQIEKYKTKLKELEEQIQIIESR